VVSNMIAILNETKSPDTFIVTISTLMVLKDAGKLKNPNLAQVLPAIIRNAERLGLWKGMIEEDEITGTVMQKSILECMQRLIQNSQGSNSSARSAPDCGNGRCLPPQLIPITPPSNGESRSSGPAQQPSLPAPAISN